MGFRKKLKKEAKRIGKQVNNALDKAAAKLDKAADEVEEKGPRELRRIGKQLEKTGKILERKVPREFKRILLQVENALDSAAASLDELCDDAENVISQNPGLKLRLPDLRAIISGDGNPNLTEVIPGLFLASKDVRDANLQQFDSILTMLDESSEQFSKDFLSLPINDKQCQNISDQFPAGINFIRSELSEGKKVVVNCRRGMSRSVAMVAAYLISEQGNTLDEALSTIRGQDKRIIGINIGFMEQLRTFEEEVKRCREAERADEPEVDTSGLRRGMSCHLGNDMSEVSLIDQGGREIENQSSVDGHDSVADTVSNHEQQEAGVPTGDIVALQAENDAQRLANARAAAEEVKAQQFVSSVVPQKGNQDPDDDWELIEKPKLQAKGFTPI